MGERDKVVNIGARSPRESGVSQERALLLRCRQIAENTLRESIKEVFDKTDDLLFDRSNQQGEADGGAARYFDALRELRIKRQAIAQAFLDGALREHDHRLRRALVTAAGKPGGRTPQSGGLSLIGEKELEESLAVEGMVGKAQERFSNGLYGLSQRYTLLAEGVTFEGETHPLAPDAICHAFRDALGGIELGVEIKLIIYKLFEKHAAKNFGELYDKLNGVLADAGILPQLKSAVPVRSNAAAERPHAAEEATGMAAGNSLLPVPVSSLPGMMGGEAGGDGADVYHTLQRLMNLKKYGGATAVGGGSMPGGAAGTGHGIAGSGGGSALPAAPVAAAVLIEGLSLLQQLPPPPPEMTAGHAAIAYIKSSLLERIGDSALGKTIDPVTDNTIDVIGMIFEFILDETSIPESVKRLLNQLQIPILKVAIVDKEFFANKQHPARRLLNSLGHASIGWNDKEPLTQQRRFEKMEYLVGRVLKEYQTDPSVFAELLADFTAFLTVEVDDEEPVQEESPRTAMAEELIVPEKRAFETVELRLDGVEAPRLVRDFLRNTWRRALEQVAADEDAEGDSWRRRVQLMDDLLWSVEPKPSGDERRRMVALLPRLLSGLQDGMSAVGCQPAEMDAVLNGLQPIHMACLRGEAPPPDVGVAAPALPDRAPASQDVTDMIRSIQQAMAPVDDKDAAADLARPAHGDEFRSAPATLEESPFEFAEELVEDEFTEQARTMAVSTWLEFVQGDKRRRGKLGWKSVVLGQYVFVDRRYKVVVEHNLAELAADLRAGRARIVEKIGMFDRALDAVMQSLMSGAGVR
ncbi:MAG: DUF1631 domain-containing protein [Pseudomonadota bacterium]